MQKTDFGVIFIFSIIAFAIMSKRNPAWLSCVFASCLEFLFIMITLDLKSWCNNLSVVAQNVYLLDNFNGLL